MNTTPVHLNDPGFEYTIPDKFGSIPTIVAIVLVVSVIGYLANAMDMGHTKTISDAIRGLGAIFPPLGALLGFM